MGYKASCMKQLESKCYLRTFLTLFMPKLNTLTQAIPDWKASK